MYIKAKTDSIQNVTRKCKELIINSLSVEHDCDTQDINIKHLYISKGTSILHTPNIFDDAIVLFSDSLNYLYLSYSILNKENECCKIGPYNYEYLIPIAREKEAYYYLKTPETEYDKKELSKWMIELINELIK
jgi:hypothetical protein